MDPHHRRIDRTHLERALRQRDKEIHCLRGVAQLAEQHTHELEKVLQGVVELCHRRHSAELHHRQFECNDPTGQRQVTEQTAAGSEEMASSSEELGAQAQALRDLVSRFNTGSSR